MVTPLVMRCREIAKRLASVIRTEDTVARLGGDESSIVLGRARNKPTFRSAQRAWSRLPTARGSGWMREDHSYRRYYWLIVA